MKDLITRILIASALVATCFGQAGSNTVQAITSGTLVQSASIIDATVFTGLDMCQKINNAITTVVSNSIPVTIDARGFTGPQACNSNPFAGAASSYTGRLLLGGVTINTSVQWTMPIQFFWIEGIAMANMAGSVGTIIKATSNFGCTGSGNITVNVANPAISGCPVVFISGTGFTTVGYDSFGTGIRNLTIDCNSVSACIGTGSFDTQEGGGIDTVGFINQTKACVVFDAAEVSHLGTATGVSNPFLRNIDCTFLTTATSGIGIYMNAQDGPAEISNTTVSVPNASSQNPVISTCLEFNGGRGTNINYFHCEHALTAEVIGDSNVAHDVNIHGLTASATNLGVSIKNTGDFDIAVETVDMEGSPTNFIGALMDAPNSTTISAKNLSHYVMSTAGGTLYTTDSNPTTVLSLGTLSKVRLFPNTLSQLNGLPVQPPAGTVTYCQDCMPNSGTSACSSGGTGALAVRENLTGWYCK